MAGVGQFMAHHVHHYHRYFDGVEVDPYGVGGGRVDPQGCPGLSSGRRRGATLLDDPLFDQAGGL